MILESIELENWKKFRNPVEIQFKDGLNVIYGPNESGKTTLMEGLKLVLVDEYQDTNLLQEQIYFKLAEAAACNGGSFTVVGDDDQSLYRFRGATVDLFTNFKERCEKHLKIAPELINLSKNYRSTCSIVDFCNRFAVLDDDFQGVRVDGKPPIEAARTGDFCDFPVLGMGFNR